MGCLRSRDVGSARLEAQLNKTADGKANQGGSACEPFLGKLYFSFQTGCFMSQLSSFYTTTRLSVSLPVCGSQLRAHWFCICLIKLQRAAFAGQSGGNSEFLWTVFSRHIISHSQMIQRTSPSVCTALQQEVVLSGGAGLWTPSHALTRPPSKLTGSPSCPSGVEVAHWSPCS